MAGQQHEPERGGRVGDDLASVADRLGQEGQALSGTVARAGETVGAGAQALGEQASERIGAEVEGAAKEAVAGLSAFSDALKAASSELSGKQLGFAGDVVQQAAGGLETLARSLEDRSPAEMLDGIRAFGRQNPVGFIAGSILAGFALGRVAAAVPSGREDARPEPQGSATVGAAGAPSPSGAGTAGGFGA